MLDEDNNTPAANTDESGTGESGGVDLPAEKPAKKTAAKKTAAKKTTKKTAAKKTAAKKAAPAPAGDEAAAEVTPDEAEKPAKKAATKKTAAKKTPAKKAATKKSTPRKSAVKTVAAPEPAAESGGDDAPATAVLFQVPEPTKAPVRRARKAAQTKQVPAEAASPEASEQSSAPADSSEQAEASEPKQKAPAKKKAAAKKQAPEPDEGDQAGQADQTEESGEAEKPAKGKKSGKKSGQKKAKGSDGSTESEASDEKPASPSDQTGDQDSDKDSDKDGSAAAKGDADQANGDGDDTEDSGGPRRRRRRGGRRRRKSNDGGSGGNGDSSDDQDDEGSDDSDSGDGSSSGGSRRRRRRRRAGDNGGGASDDPENTVTRVRQGRSVEDQITAVSGSTRLEAKKQRRREGREAGRRRAPIVSEAEFLARRESVDRKMVVRQRKDLTQIAVLEDKVLVEHYVARESQTSLIGNVYVGRVQNVLPSMEAAFVDIGKGRNAVIYAGEVNWAALGHKDGQPRKIESVLSSGQSILVQVTKDPIGHKGARLTGQVSLAGRFLVYVPDGTTSGISRKLPDTERARLKGLLKEIVPDTAGVIVRTAAEGASEEELTRDVERLKARWEDIESKSSSGGAPKLLYGEPDLTLKVVRDLFTEDFSKLVIEGDDAWQTVKDYVSHVAPDLEDRLEKFESEGERDSFAVHRIDEQIAKGVDRKVWLPSGGSLIIDRTEAMTVVDVNTGKFTGSGGNLEETVTKNNLEAAEEIVRQLRLRDIGGIIVVDFIDMVLESNRDLVLRRLVECLGRDRTRHQVAEVTSLGLVQMTRKRIGTGLLEAFSEECEHCHGRGLVVHDMPIEPKRSDDGGRSGGRRGRRGKGDGHDNNSGGKNGGRQSSTPSPKDVAAVAKPENADKPPADAAPATDTADKPVTSEKASEATQPSDGQATEPSDAGSTVSKSTRRRSSRRTTTQSEAQPQADNEPEAQPRTDSTPEPATTAEPAPKGAAEAAPEAAGTTAEAPQVVTRTRRRASRSGVSSPGQATAITVSAAPPAPASETTDEPTPTVVTTTRNRRGVTRRASSGATGSAESGESAETPDVPSAELHVPVKKKGSRKR